MPRGFVNSNLLSPDGEGKMSFAIFVPGGECTNFTLVSIEIKFQFLVPVLDFVDFNGGFRNGVLFFASVCQNGNICK